MARVCCNASEFSVSTGAASCLFQLCVCVGGGGGGIEIASGNPFHFSSVLPTFTQTSGSSHFTGYASTFHASNIEPETGEWGGGGGAYISGYLCEKSLSLCTARLSRSGNLERWRRFEMAW